MERKKTSVLIIDDHPLICDAYVNALHFIEKENSEISFKITLTHNCDDAIAKIKESSRRVLKYELIFLDIKLPPSKDKKILSGEDLGLEIKKLLPDSKIIVSTTYNDNYRIYSLMKNLNPDGLLIKNDITTSELVNAINLVLTSPPYYSSSVSQTIRNEMLNDLLLDKIDRRLLYELSIGTKTKDLPITLPLSIAGVEKRKRNLKNVFDVSGLEDKDLINKAKEKGFI
jgi:DNA-binding NarL/FixJ family response regulator|tara:strand:- start:199 stop:882 length:684 start_codon:yes stop_codon:yes gene_type:complete